MIDPALLRKDLANVTARLAARGYTLDVAAFELLEASRKRVQMETEQLQNRRKTLSKEIGRLKGQKQDASAPMAEVAEVGTLLEQASARNDEIQQELAQWVQAMPNLPHESVPPGTAEQDNVEVRRWQPEAAVFELSV